MKKLLSCLLCLVLLLAAAPQACATEMESDLCPDLSDYIADPSRRSFVQQTVGYSLRHDTAVRENLKSGYCAVFFFEGCSDNMNHPEYRDLSYYRVSAVCLVIKLNAAGVPELTYFNGDCSTLPDRPLDYGPRKEEVPADVGPATIQDGTYEIYSVRHGGKYEALHMRTAYEDEAIPAIYMTPHGYAKVLATQINILTRTNNHILKYVLWSEGCILVGNGDDHVFTDFIASTFYEVYDYFITDLRVGTVTINRQYLKEELYDLYGDEDAVDFLLSASRPFLPRKYLEQCTALGESTETTLWASQDTDIMTLPCGNATDARSVLIGTLKEGTSIRFSQVISNTRGAEWYEITYESQTGYVFSGHFREPTRVESLWINLFG